MSDFDYSSAYKVLEDQTLTATSIPYSSAIIKAYNSSDAVTDIGIELSDILKRVIALENSKPEFVELKCKNCGGKIQQRYEDNIIKCPYCKSVYIIGRKQVNDDT